MRLLATFSLLPVLLQAVQLKLLGNPDILISNCDGRPTKCYYAYVKECCRQENNPRCTRESNNVLCLTAKLKDHDYCKKSFEQLVADGGPAPKSPDCSSMETFLVQDWPPMKREPLKREPNAPDLPWVYNTQVREARRIVKRSDPNTTAAANPTTATTEASTMPPTTATTPTTVSPTPGATDSSPDSHGQEDNTPGIDTATKTEDSKLSTGVIAIIGVVAGIVVIVTIISLVVCLLKRKQKKGGTETTPTVDNKNSKRKRLMLPKALGGSKAPKSVSARKTPLRRQKKEKSHQNVEPGIIDKDHFQFVGPLLFRAGQSKPIAHELEGMKDISLKEVVFDDNMNKAFDIGSEQEKYELDTEDCKTVIVSDSQTLVPTSQLVSLVTEDDKKDLKKKNSRHSKKSNKKSKKSKRSVSNEKKSKEKDKNKQTSKEKEGKATEKEAADKAKTDKEGENPPFEKTQ